MTPEQYIEYLELYYGISLGILSDYFLKLTDNADFIPDLPKLMQYNYILVSLKCHRPVELCQMNRNIEELHKIRQILPEDYQEIKRILRYYIKKLASLVGDLNNTYSLRDTYEDINNQMELELINLLSKYYTSYNSQSQTITVEKQQFKVHFKYITVEFKLACYYYKHPDREICDISICTIDINGNAKIERA